MTFFADHSNDGTLLKWRLYYLGMTLPGTVAAGVASGSHAVTPASMYGISVGSVLTVQDADGTNPETVTVTATTTSTFTATFAHAHGANWLFAVPIPIYWTDCPDLNIVTTGGVAGAHTWVSIGIIPGTITQQPDGASASFTVPDADGTLFPILAANNAGEMSPAAIYEAGFLITNKTATPDEVLQVFTGRIDRAAASTSGRDAIDFTLMPPTQQNAAEGPTRLVSSLVRVT